jgi:hypothetical protein
VIDDFLRFSGRGEKKGEKKAEEGLFFQWLVDPLCKRN